MDDFFEDIRFLFVFLLFIFGVVLLIGGLVVSVNYASCKGFESGTGIETKWKFGCYANVNGEWLPAEYVFGDVNELRIKGEQK